ncbi:MAG TPA: hypothetical protein VK045_00040, partial [Ornithinicoccus sp.]|nr:hypothetical protein [Ornithinicoccus sp.]
WPLGLAVAAVLPQFSLPPVGRMAFGIAYAGAAAVLVAATLRAERDSASRQTAAPRPGTEPLGHRTPSIR